MTDVVEIGSGNNANIVIGNTTPPVAVTDVQAQGPPGPPGGKGDAGSLTIGTVTTGAAGSSASATITGDAPSQILNLTIPRGNVGDPTAFELRGTGMPNGIVTAGPGAYYTDTAGTNGAWRWLKKSGTGNTGWSVMHGDTGWRDVTALAVGHPGIASGTIRIRRVGEVSFIRLSSLTFSSDYTRTSELLTLPSGFVFGPIAGLASRANGLASTTNIALTPAGQFYILDRNLDSPTTSIPAGWPLSGMFSGPASQAWPTTLPGTPA